MRTLWKILTKKRYLRKCPYGEHSVSPLFSTPFDKCTHEDCLDRRLDLFIDRIVEYEEEIATLKEKLRCITT